MNIEFVPDSTQILTVTEMVSKGYNATFICEYIINPNTQKPIDIKTFYKAFRPVMNQARKGKLDRILDNLYDMAKDKDINAIRLILNLQGRGLLKEKFEFDENDTIEGQYNQIIKAGAAGLIHADEVAAYCNAIKSKADNKLDIIIPALETINEAPNAGKTETSA